MNPFQACTLCSICLIAIVATGCDSASKSERTVKAPDATSIAPSAETQSGSSTPGKAFYYVDHYDVNRDPAKDLIEACATAKRDNKRVLVQVGGDWCGCAN